MSGFEIALWAITGLIAVSALVKLMAAHRQVWVNRLREESAQIQAAKRAEESKAAKKAKPPGRGNAA